MSMLFGSPAAPPPPPPPPAAPSLAQPSIAEAGAQEQQRLASAEGAGFLGTDVTAPGGTPAPQTTNPGATSSSGTGKTLLG